MSDPASRKPEEIASNISDSEIDMVLERNIAVDVNQPQNKTIGHKRQSGKRRRTYEPSGLDIAPYHKKPKVTKSTILPLNYHKRGSHNIISEEEATAWKKDMWMADMLIDEDETTPMFVGCNAQLLPREDEIQNIVYLPQINASPT